MVEELNLLLGYQGSLNNTKEFIVKKKILIIDDEEAFTRILKLNLEATGLYLVHVENRGSHAFNTARFFQPDMIFLDLIMPDLEGSQVAYQIRNDEFLRNIPVIFLTATVTSDEVKKHDGLIGGQHFLAKPVNVDQIIECIHRNLVVNNDKGAT